MAASIADTMRAVNEACRSRGGKYAEYSCEVVSWDDVSRGTVGGNVSCWGANITDTYLKSKDGTQLFTVRPDNWNEKLGRVATSDVAVVSGNHVPDGRSLEPITLRAFLKDIGTYGKYAGLPAAANVSDDGLDARCSIRFQTTFLPVSGARGTLEFATEAYNYNTLADEDPRNLVLLCTSQGVAIQQDGTGAKRLFHHAVDENLAIHRYWLEAERSDHKVGGAQKETDAERADALARGKATASVIGTQAMGTRFNVLMTVQVPLRQKKKPKPTNFGCGSDSADSECGGSSESEFGGFAKPKSKCKLDARDFDLCAAPFACFGRKSIDLGGDSAESGSADSDDGSSNESVQASACGHSTLQGSCNPSSQRVHSGTANAARVSRGTEFDVWPGLSVANPERNRSEHVTVTVVIYNTISDGVPSATDVGAAIDDLEDLYAKCSAHSQLADNAFDFMKTELTVEDVVDITAKIVTRPYKPQPQTVNKFDQFPA